MEQECRVCHMPITNPLCPECLTEEMSLWAYDYKEKLAERIKSFSEIIDYNENNYEEKRS